MNVKVIYLNCGVHHKADMIIAVLNSICGTSL